MPIGRWFTFPKTVGLQSGPAIQAIVDNLSSYQELTAGTTQSQAGGTAITSALANITVSANAGDAVKLPALSNLQIGTTITVTNNGAQSAQIYASGSDVINATAGATGVALAAAATAMFRAVKITTAGVTTWKRFVSA